MFYTIRVVFYQLLMFTRYKVVTSNLTTVCHDAGELLKKSVGGIELVQLTVGKAEVCLHP